jgi:hypothetical protein
MVEASDDVAYAIENGYAVVSADRDFLREASSDRDHTGRMVSEAIQGGSTTA